MDIPNWVVDVFKIGGTGAAGVLGGVKLSEGRLVKLEERATALEESKRNTVAALDAHGKQLDQIQRLNSVDHDILTGLASQMSLLLKSMHLESDS